MLIRSFWFVHFRYFSVIEEEKAARHSYRRLVTASELHRSSYHQQSASFNYINHREPSGISEFCGLLNTPAALFFAASSTF
jgi:hypothetical protein